MHTDVERYYRDGGIIIDTPLKQKMMDIRSIFVEVFDRIASAHGVGPIRNDADITRLYRSDARHLWVAAFDQLSNLPEVMALCNEPCLLEALKSIGFKRPSMPRRGDIRADMPSDKKWDISSHQDYVYHYGSNNAVTVWMPFQDVPVELGALQVVWGTHLEGSKPQVKGILTNVEGVKFEPVPTKAGQVFFFQFLYHRSGQNSTDRIRFSIQIRYNDLGAQDYQKRQFYLNWDDLKKNDKDPAFETSFPISEKKNN